MSQDLRGPSSDGAPRAKASRRRAPRKTWHYHPTLPIHAAPFYDWPIRPLAIAKHMLRSWSPFSERIVFLLIAIVIWFNFSPSLEQTSELRFDWVAEIWIRNFLLILAVAGGLHLFFYTFRKQSDDLRYDARDFAQNSKIFTFRNQVWDNMFWTLTTGVLFWTAWESLMMWAYANGIAPYISFESNPVWFVALIFLTPYWAGVFFYWFHRLLHVGPLYRLIHSWHHKNVNTGPWSGLAMHPIEQLFLMADTALYLVVASHPIHVIYNLLFHGLGAPTSHTGFDGLRVLGGYKYQLGDFFHQLHHRFIDCNYGVVDTPWDKWFGTLHDGTPEGEQYIMEMRRKMMEKKAEAA